MSERPSDRWLALVLAVVTHLAIAGALIWGYWNYKHPAPKPQQLAIEATVVDASTLRPGTLPGPAPTPAPLEPTPPPAEEPTPQPAPAPVEDSARKAQELKEQAREEQERQEAKAKQEAKGRQDAKADAKAQAQARAAAEAKQQAEQASKEKAAKEKAAADAKAEQQKQAAAEKKTREEADRLVREKSEADRQKAQSEAELHARMAAEEHLLAAQASGLMAQYQAQIRARIERAWIRPASAKPGLSCEVRITQVPGGEVVGVKVGACNGDDSVRQSIETAAYRASPLPLPPDPALFDRNLVVTFKPQD